MLKLGFCWVCGVLDEFLLAILGVFVGLWDGGADGGGEDGGELRGEQAVGRDDELFGVGGEFRVRENVTGCFEPGGVVVALS